MKRIFILLVIAMMATVAFAEQTTLIDFSMLVDDTTIGDGIPQHEGTLVDFASVAGASFDPEQRAMMKSSLYIENWEVVLNSSAQNAMSLADSQIRAAQVREGAEKFGGQYVLGARVSFPTEAWNAWAMIQPPFEIQAYANPTSFDGEELVETGTTGDKFEGFGVVKNVGVIKQIGINIYGLNFPHSLSVILEDENHEQVEVAMGYLDFDGWRTLIWDNPNYISNVRDRELRSYPLYPYLEPMRRLVGFRIYRDGATTGGDFVTYLKDVTLVYDEARLELEADIDHDMLWEILSEREADRRRAELNRIGDLQVLRYVEEQLQADPETEDLRTQQ